MAIPNHYPIGSTVRMSSAFVDINGAAIDPSLVQLFVEDPTGVVTTYSQVSLSHAGVGVFQLSIVCAISGTWEYQFQAPSGTVVVSSPPNSFIIDPSEFIRG